MPEFHKVIAELDQFGGLSLPEDYVTRVNAAYEADVAEEAAKITPLQSDLAERDAKLQQMREENQRLVRAVPADSSSNTPPPKPEEPKEPQKFGLDRLR